MQWAGTVSQSGRCDDFFFSFLPTSRCCSSLPSISSSFSLFSTALLFYTGQECCDCRNPQSLCARTLCTHVRNQTVPLSAQLAGFHGPRWTNRTARIEDSVVVVAAEDEDFRGPSSSSSVAAAAEPSASDGRTRVARLVRARGVYSPNQRHPSAESPRQEDSVHGTQPCMYLYLMNCLSLGGRACVWVGVYVRARLTEGTF